MGEGEGERERGRKDGGGRKDWNIECQRNVSDIAGVTRHVLECFN